MTKIGKKFIAEIRKIAQEMPDGRSPNCVYVDPETGQPSCIVGRALFGLKVITDPEKILNGKSSIEHYSGSEGQIYARGLNESTFTREWINDARLGSKLQIYQSELNWIKHVQFEQDQNAKPWAEAVALADKFYGKRLPK